jgi:hypothetical protein
MRPDCARGGIGVDYQRRLPEQASVRQRRRTMMRLAIPIFVALCVAAQTASAGHFYIEAKLRDGKTVVKGYLPEKRASFEALAADGKAVTVRFEKLPDFAKREWSQEILWDEKLGLFILQAPSWTGLLKQLWDKLELDASPPADPGRSPTERELDAAMAEGKKLILKGSDVADVRLRYIDPAKEAIKPGKKR